MFANHPMSWLVFVGLVVIVAWIAVVINWNEGRYNKKNRRK